ncbi:MAG: hypothetical protein IT290_06055 [Deltaproteobacteria bacterium]|nr:hypothetical protein [Deltaproteobacteria bacterium]
MTDTTIPPMGRSSDEFLRRNQARFLWLSAGAIVVLSFLYGLSAGFNRNLQGAIASKEGFVPLDSYAAPVNIVLPPGVRVMPVGQDASINGRPGEMVHFESDRGVLDILQQQTKYLESRGSRVIGLAGKHRGFLLAVHPKTGARHTTVAFASPANVAGQANSQGYATFVDPSAPTAASEMAPDEVSGVPVPPNGKVTASFASRDFGGRSHTAFYSVAGGVGENAQYYENTLPAAGWRRAPGPGEMKEGTVLTFQRGTTEVLLMFVDASGASDQKKTVVLIISRPMGVSASA